VSIAHLDGGALSPAAAARMGLPFDAVTGVTRDHLLLGSATGDCIAVDCTAG
jgi:hypothetical protein